MTNNKRGFASMSDEQQRDAASQGGQSQGRENNPGNFANDPEKARKAGQRGGQNSHGNRNDGSNERDHAGGDEGMAEDGEQAA